MTKFILLIEDNEDDVFLLKHAAKKAGIEESVATACDGQAAIEILQEAINDPSVVKLPSLILLDLKMPRVPGLEFLVWLRQQPALRMIPVVILTSSVADKDVAAAYTLGANSYIQKPAASHELSDIIGLLNVYWMKRCILPPVFKPATNS